MIIMILMPSECQSSSMPPADNARSTSDRVTKMPTKRAETEPNSSALYLPVCRLRCWSRWLASGGRRIPEGGFNKLIFCSRRPAHGNTLFSPSSSTSLHLVFIFSAHRTKRAAMRCDTDCTAAVHVPGRVPIEAAGDLYVMAGALTPWRTRDPHCTCPRDPD